MNGEVYSHVKSYIKEEARDSWQTLGATSVLMPTISYVVSIFVESHRLGNSTVSAANTTAICALISMTALGIAVARRLAPQQLPRSNGLAAFCCTLLSMPGAITLAMLFGAAAALTIGGVADVTRHERIALAGSVATVSLMWFGVVLTSASTVIGLGRIFKDSRLKGVTTIALIVVLGFALMPLWALV